MPKRLAVCVGNNYPGTTAELSGCANDAQDWAGLLAGAGYEVAAPYIEAPKALTVAVLRAAVARLSWGDRLVFTFSGHGSWVPDVSGDEADRRDEVLCCADYDDGGLLSDDELQRIFGDVPSGAAALILSDSCHSGTVSRFAAVTGLAARAVDPEPIRPRFLSPAEFTDLTAEEVATREAVPASLPRATASLVSGCADLEYSYDAWFNGRANGAFTRAALDTYTPGASLAGWHQRIRAVLPSEAYPQSPQLTAASLYRRYARAL